MANIEPVVNMDGAWSGNRDDDAQSGTFMTIAAANREPVVTKSDVLVQFIESYNNAPPTPVAVDPQIRVEDPDGTLVSATVSLGATYTRVEDRLDLVNPGTYGLAASWNADTGTLTLTATAGSVAVTQMQDALSSVRYTNIADEPRGSHRSVTFVVNDGIASSAAVNKMVYVAQTSDRTIVDLNGGAEGQNVTLAYTEQAPAIPIAPNATVIDVDSTDFRGGVLGVSNVLIGPGDFIAIRPTGNGPGQIGVEGTNVLYGGTVIGTMSSTVINGRHHGFAVTLQAGATPAAVQAVMRTLTFVNEGDNPFAQAQFDIRITDGMGGQSAVVRATVQIATVDDPTIFDLNGAAPGTGGAATYQAGSVLTAITPAAVVTDPDIGNFAGGSLHLRLIGGQPGDVVGIVNQGRGAGQILVDEFDTLFWSGMAMGKVFPLEGRVELDSNTVPMSAVQALVRAIGFTNINADPGAQTRTVELTLKPPAGAAALVQNVTIAVPGGSANMVLVGDDGANDLRGAGGNDVLRGMAGNDILRGMAGDDRLEGGAGADRMEGGAGNDTFLVDAAGDVAIELAGEGVDLVEASRGYTLPDHVENLYLSGTAAIDGSGNALGNRIEGNNARNRLLGGGGDDLILFGLGGDTVDGGAGTDTLELNRSPGSFRFLEQGGKAFIMSVDGAVQVNGIERVTAVGSGSYTWAQVQSGFFKFDGLRYVASYPDLIRAYGADGDGAAAHYAAAGFAEGRSAYGFRALSYVAGYADLIAGFGTDEAAATRHYITAGQSEGRSPTRFDGLLYAASYSDLALRFGPDEDGAAAHYITEGYAEGRRISFDGLGYIATNIARFGAMDGDPRTAAYHYLTVGQYSGLTDDGFDGLRYLASYADLARGFGGDLTGGTRHFIQSGYAEGRVADAGFDEVAYLLTYRDLQAARMGADAALAHWVQAGAREGRLGDTRFGREQSDHLLAAGTREAAAIETAGDRDWFEFTVASGRSVSVALNSDAVDGMLQLHRSTGELVASVHTDAGHDARLQFVASGTDAYYLTFAAEGAATGGYLLDLTLM